MYKEKYYKYKTKYLKLSARGGGSCQCQRPQTQQTQHYIYDDKVDSNAQPIISVLGGNITIGNSYKDIEEERLNQLYLPVKNLNTDTIDIIIFTKYLNRSYGFSLINQNMKKKTNGYNKQFENFLEKIYNLEQKPLYCVDEIYYFSIDCINDKFYDLLDDMLTNIPRNVSFVCSLDSNMNLIDYFRRYTSTRMNNKYYIYKFTNISFIIPKLPTVNYARSVFDNVKFETINTKTKRVQDCFIISNDIHVHDLSVCKIKKTDDQYDLVEITQDDLTTTIPNEEYPFYHYLLNLKIKKIKII